MANGQWSVPATVSSEHELWKLMHEAAVEAADAKRRRDAEGYKRAVERRKALERAYLRLGHSQDELEVEKQKRGLLTQVADLGQSVAMLGAVVLAFLVWRGIR